MKSFERLFENFFDDSRITPARLANFAQDTLNKLTAAAADPAPPGNPFTDIINRITPNLAELQTQLGNVDASVTLHRGATLGNNQVMAAFRKMMSTQKGVIADKMGGLTSVGYLQFYPHGLSEYTRCKKTEMPVLTG